MDKVRERIANETLLFLKSNSWESITIDKILERSKLGRKKFQNYIKKKFDLLENINNFFDDKVIDDSNTIENSSKKDMIFEVLMMRFDLLNQYRPQIIKIFNLLKKKPQYSIRVLPSFIDSMNKMLKKSKIETNGIKGNLKIKGLLVIYFSTFLTWINDESESLDKTMMKLDDNLEKSAKLIKLIDK